MRRSQQLALAGIVGILAVGQPAEAARLILGAYYEDNGAVNCTSSPCRLAFANIPAGEHVLITHIACHIDYLDSFPPLTLVELHLFRPAGIMNEVRRETLHIDPPRIAAGSNFYTVGGDVQFRYKPGDFPGVSVYLAGDTDIFVRCRITGVRPAPN